MAGLTPPSSGFAMPSLPVKRTSLSVTSSSPPPIVALSTSSSSSSASTAATTGAITAATPTGGVRIVTMTELSTHNTVKDCWCAVNGRAYNLTAYLRLHPGGINLIARLAGADATRDFEALFHSVKARRILDFYYVGDIHGARGLKPRPQPLDPATTRRAVQHLFVAPPSHDNTDTSTSSSAAAVTAASSITPLVSSASSNNAGGFSINLIAPSDSSTTSVPQSPPSSSSRRPLVPIFAAQSVDNSNEGKFLNEIEDEQKLSAPAPVVVPTTSSIDGKSTDTNQSPSLLRFWLESVRLVATDTRIFSFRAVKSSPPQATLAIPTGKHLYIIVPSSSSSFAPSSSSSVSSLSSTTASSTSSIVPSSSTITTDDQSPAIIRRAYTPISYDAGGFELLVKVYRNGVASQYINSLRPGQHIQAIGPFGQYVYERNKYQHTVMLAAGTGITPMYQILCASLSSSLPSSRYWLLFANRHETDILLRSELDRLATTSSRLTVQHCLSQPTGAWPTDTTGRIDRTMMSRLLAEPFAALDCHHLCMTTVWSSWISSKVDQIMALSIDRAGVTQLAAETWLASLGVIGCLLLQRAHGSHHHSRHSRHGSNGHSGGHGGGVIDTWRTLPWLLQLTLFVTMIWYIWHALVTFDCYPSYNHISQLRWFTGVIMIISWFISTQRYTSHHGGIRHAITVISLLASLIIHASLARDDVAAHITATALHIADALLVCAIGCWLCFFIGGTDHIIFEWAAIAAMAGLQSCIYAVGTHRRPQLPWNVACESFTFPAYAR